MFAVFVLVVGLAAGAYLTIHRPGQQPTEVSAQPVVGQPIDRVEEQQQQRQATDGYRQEKLREQASRSATRDAQQKAAAGGQHAAALAGDADAAKKQREQQQSSSGSGSSGGSVGPVPSSCKEYSGNRATGCTLMLQAGFQIDQMACLDKLWTRESGWNVHASNPSGAYGIPQALPGDKMAEYGSDWQDNPVPQIKWGLDYIKGKYSTPCGAWQHSESTGWY